MSLFAIGDIHGCFTALKTVFRAAGIQPSDTVVFLGDYISRGPDSRKVLKWLRKRQGEYNFVLLRGNHEVMMLRARKGKIHFEEWLRYGGDTVLKSYGSTRKSKWESEIPQSHWKLLKQTKKYWLQDDFVFVHAGMLPGKPPEEQSTHTLFWRKFKKPDEYAADKTVICGHTSRKDGRIADFGHTICLDTYAYGGQWLTCLNAHTGEYWQANQLEDVRTGRLRTRISEGE